MTEKANSTIRRLSTLLAISVSLGTAHAELQSRDINGDSVVDAFYDTGLNITWLRNANQNGLMTWGAAQSWSSSLSIYGITGWRLPASDACTQYQCNGEQVQLWRELGNQGSPTLLVGSFQHYLASTYWSGTTHAGDASKAYYFNTYVGAQGYVDKGNAYLAMAVHNGDVAPVPEPTSAALILSGLLLVGLRACGICTLKYRVRG